MKSMHYFATVEINFPNIWSSCFDGVRMRLIYI